MNRDFQLILLPGLGADHRLLMPQRQAFPQLIVPPWIPPRRKESLPDYAARMAETVAPSRDKPLVLGGVSFGGMLAYEMARHLKPDAVVLIASCRNRRGMRSLYRLGGLLLPVIPAMAIWGIPTLLAGPVMSLRTRTPAAQRMLLVEMFKEMDYHFMHWVVQAILSWRPKLLKDIPIHQIHGRRDLMIPARLVEADEYIHNGGHLINCSHADRVNEFIAGSLKS